MTSAEPDAAPTGPHTDEHDRTQHPRLPPPLPWQRNLVFGTIGFTIVLGWVGDILSGALVDTHPLTLLMLNAKPRYQLLTVNQLEPWVYYVFTTVRLLCTKPLVWLVGAWYGHRAVGWAEQRSKRGADTLRWIERQFPKWGWLAITITSNNFMCLLAGASGFPLGWFMVLAVAGTLVRLWAVDVAGNVLERPIDAVIGFVADNRLAVVAVMTVIVVGGIWWQHRSGRSELDDLRDLEHTLDEDDDVSEDADRT